MRGFACQYGCAVEGDRRRVAEAQAQGLERGGFVRQDHGDTLRRRYCKAQVVSRFGRRDCVRSGRAPGMEATATGEYVDSRVQRVYAHGQESIPFWEGASLEWGKQYALDAVKWFVVGGDGANWIRQGADELPNSEFQLDGFHLARACGRGYGKKLGRAIYEAIRSGDSRRALARMKEAAPAQTRTSARDRRYVEHNVVAGVDWRNRVSYVPKDARSLGTMESNGDKLTANRMKKRGMSWTIRGANHMAKTIQLCRNAELPKYCRNTRVARPARPPTRRRPHRRPTPESRAGALPEASMPALVGPHAARPWATSLKHLTQYPRLVI